MAKKTKEPMTWTGLSGLLVATSPAKLTVRAHGQDEFEIYKNELGRVLYDDGTWGHAMVKPGKLVRDFEIAHSVAVQRGFA